MLTCLHSSRKCFYDSVIYFLHAIFMNVGKKEKNLQWPSNILICNACALDRITCDSEMFTFRLYCVIMRNTKFPLGNMIKIINGGE